MLTLLGLCFILGGVVGFKVGKFCYETKKDNDILFPGDMPKRDESPYDVYRQVRE